MVPTYFRRELRDRALQRPSWLRTFLVFCRRVIFRSASITLDVRIADRAIEGRSPHRRSREARRIERQEARRRGQGRRQARPADRDHARHHRLRLLADPQRDRSGSPDAGARRARRAAGAAGGDGARQVAGLSRLVARRQADARAARHSRAVAGRRRTRSRYHAGAAGGVRPARPSHRLWRRALRLHAGAFAQDEGDHRDRPCLRGAGNRGGTGVVARRGAGLCANGNRRHSISGVHRLAHSFRRRRGRPVRPHRYRRTSAGHDPRLDARSRRRQWRERRRRLRHHRGDLPGIHRRRRRCGHARQPCLGPARGAGVHRARAAAGPAGEFSEGHAGPRRGFGRYQERQARAGHQRDRPRLHDAVRRSVRRAQPRTRSLSAGRGRRCHRGRFPLRGVERKAGHRLLLRRPRQPRGRHPHPCADIGPSDPQPAAPPT